MTATQISITATESGTAQTIYSSSLDNGPHTAVAIGNDTTSGSTLWVNVYPVHEAGRFCPVMVGQALPFSNPVNGVGIQTIKAYATSTATANIIPLDKAII